MDDLVVCARLACAPGNLAPPDHSQRAWSGPSLRRPALRRPKGRGNTPIVFGSDCAGLLSESCALELLGVDHKHKFASDSNRQVRKLLRHRYGKRSMKLFKDVTKRDNKCIKGTVDVYVCGAPCQPWSPNGAMQGFEDSKGRGAVMLHCLNFIKEKHPRAVLFENSHALQFDKFKSARRAIVKTLHDSGYKVWRKVVNTKDYGIPQSRPRFYLIAILRKHVVHKFVFPSTIQPEDVQLFIDNDDCQRKSVEGRGAAACLSKAQLKFDRLGINPSVHPCFVDTSATTSRSSAMVGCCPCLTATRCASSSGHYLTTKHGMLTLREMCRFQGLPPTRFDVVAAGVPLPKFAHCIGNAMSVNVLMRILPRLLHSAGLIDEEIELPTKFAHLLV
jgi:DNA-cytosine methyltransferase